MPDKKALGNSNIYLSSINFKLNEIKIKSTKIELRFSAKALTKVL